MVGLGGGASTGIGVDTTGFGVDTTGFGVDTTGFGVDTTGFGVDTTGFGVDTLGLFSGTLDSLSTFSLLTSEVYMNKKRCLSLQSIKYMRLHGRYIYPAAILS